MMKTNSDVWFTSRDLIGVAGLPTTERGIRKMASSNNWLCRARNNRGALEYHISSLSHEVRAELLASRGLVETSSGLITLPQEPSRIAADDLERQRLWSCWESA
ncbi:DNA-binding protein, partial [Trabulsiella guamensis]|uniref:DNA-binding protein n=1 Tax=Trabulsiella guamensis TaxID=158852 RepID=UPI002480EFBC